MTPQIQAWIKAVRQKIPFESGRVLEIGSQNINGSVRGHFEDATEYIGIDMQDGPGVDQVVNASVMVATFGFGVFDTVICCEMLEHDIDFMGTLYQMNRLLKPGGFQIVTTPTFGFPLHRFPRDYWRFGEDAYREVFFKGFHVFNIMHLDDVAAPRGTLAAIGKKL
jgi:SAM-dependent methyltransferase